MGENYRCNRENMMSMSMSMSIRFNVHIQSKLLQHTPVMGTQSSYQLGCLPRTVG